MLYNISNNLRLVLRSEGYTKVASEVMRAQNEYVGEIDTVDGAIRSVAMKVAVNRENERVLRDGLSSLDQLKRL